MRLHQRPLCVFHNFTWHFPHNSAEQRPERGGAGKREKIIGLKSGWIFTFMLSCKETLIVLEHWDIPKTQLYHLAEDTQNSPSVSRKSCCVYSVLLPEKQRILTGSRNKSFLASNATSSASGLMLQDVFMSAVGFFESCNHQNLLVEPLKWQRFCQGTSLRCKTNRIHTVLLWNINSQSLGDCNIYSLNLVLDMFTVDQQQTRF